MGSDRRDQRVHDRRYHRAQGDAFHAPVAVQVAMMFGDISIEKHAAINVAHG